MFVCVCDIHLYRDRQREESYFKELAHSVVGAGKPIICKVGQCAGDPGKVEVQVQELPGGRIPSPSGDLSLFLKAFIQLDETHPYYGV